MGWSDWLPFGGGSESKQKQPEQATSLEGTYKPLARQERQRCWEARDNYFRCLDKSEILDAVEHSDAAAKACPEESKRFEQDCAKSWVEYFKAKRVADFNKEQQMKKLEQEGAVPMQETGKSKWKIW